MMTEQLAPEPMRVSCPACQAMIATWPPEVGDTRAVTCPECGLGLAFRDNAD